ncbi:hypothetical protein [Fontivita pretiosa]|uniref:hypothetical protein n=1 Tax=Fontivita pretiosa TaxID=2989684 RepID=UPI003D180394
MPSRSGTQAGSAARSIAFVLALIALAGSARGVITVTSTVEFKEGVRAQAVIADATGILPPGGRAPFNAIAIKQVMADIIIRDGEFSDALLVRKRQLTAAEAWGSGLPLGYTFPPPTDPEGPWQGLVWPYRDQYDYFAGPNDPLGDDVGQFFQDGSIYGFGRIAGIVRGGPTDPEAGGGDVNRLLRGITGNGLSGPATYFMLDIQPLAGPADRFVTLEIVNAHAVVVQQDQATGAYSELTVPIADFQTRLQLPEPGSAAVLGLLLALIPARARRR